MQYHTIDIDFVIVAMERRKKNKLTKYSDSPIFHFHPCFAYIYNDLLKSTILSSKMIKHAVTPVDLMCVLAGSLHVT